MMTVGCHPRVPAAAAVSVVAAVVCHCRCVLQQVLPRKVHTTAPHSTVLVTLVTPHSTVLATAHSRWPRCNQPGVSDGAAAALSLSQSRSSCGASNVSVTPCRHSRKSLTKSVDSCTSSWQSSHSRWPLAATMVVSCVCLWQFQWHCSYYRDTGALYSHVSTVKCSRRSQSGVGWWTSWPPESAVFCSG